MPLRTRFDHRCRFCRAKCLSKFCSACIQAKRSLKAASEDRDFLEKDGSATPVAGKKEAQTRSPDPSPQPQWFLSFLIGPSRGTKRPADSPDVSERLLEKFGFNLPKELQ